MRVSESGRVPGHADAPAKASSCAVNGFAVPAGIGINDGSFISPIHNHDMTGVIHVESPTQQSFSLGQFFAIWGVGFTPT